MEKIKVQLVKWGNSHAVRIPKTVLDQVAIREGDELEIRVEEGRIARRARNSEAHSGRSGCAYYPA